MNPAIKTKFPSNNLILPEPGHAALKWRLNQFLKSTLQEAVTAKDMPAESNRSRQEALLKIKDLLRSDPERLFSCLKSSGAVPIIRCFREKECWPERASAITSAMAEVWRRIARELAPAQEPRLVAPALRLTLDDTNPLAMEEAHPQKSGNKPDFGGREIKEWLKSLRSAFSLIHSVWPELKEEFSLLIDRIIPVGYNPERHFSASYREAIGTIYLTLHPDPLVMATALIHEFQHNKINLISYFDPLLNNAFRPLYKSPVRPDPRPLWGVLLAVHAFVPVEIFYRRLQQDNNPQAQRNDFQALCEETQRKNAEGLAVLSSYADWTPLGQALMLELTSAALKRY